MFKIQFIQRWVACFNLNSHFLFQGVSATRSSSSIAASTTSKMSAVNSALLVATQSEVEESAQSILERHVSRVFDSPDAQQTPTTTVDCQPFVGLATAISLTTNLDHRTTKCDISKKKSLNTSDTTSNSFSSLLPLSSKTGSNRATSHVLECLSGDVAHETAQWHGSAGDVRQQLTCSHSCTKDK